MNETTLVETEQTTAPEPIQAAVIAVKDLQVKVHSKLGELNILKDVSFRVLPGETLGLVGESGSSKSMTANALLGLLPTTADCSAEQLQVCGVDILDADAEQLRALRGNRAGMILQDPTASLNPSIRVGAQVAEPLVVHHRADTKNATDAAIKLLERVGIHDAEKRSRNFPHQFSGGMRQRIVGAAAISCSPDLIIADEPTTALDVTVQSAYLQLLSELQAETNAAMLFISHDLGVVSRVCDRVIVMYAGTVVESAPTSVVFADARHPYTMGLLSCLPSMTEVGQKLTPIAGAPPSPLDSPPGCFFAARCPAAIARCHTERPTLTSLGDGHEVACFRAEEKLGRTDVWPVSRSTTAKSSASLNTEAPVLELRDIRRSFVTKKSIWGKPKETFEAVRGVSITVSRGESVSIVGESGSGKTTCAKIALGLDNPSSGQVFFEGRELSGLSKAETKEFRRKVQAVFQDPFSSFNPRRTIRDAVIEPLQELWEGLDRTEMTDRAAEALNEVGLDPARVLSVYPHQLSGGQRQRVAIARAMVTKPDCLVLDEPVSALDISVRVQVLNVLREVQEHSGVGILAISHDLGSVKYMSDRVVVMYQGKVVEDRPAADLFAAPEHEYTRQLLRDAMVTGNADMTRG